MSAIRPFSYGQFGRIPDVPEPIEECCGNCKYHYYDGEDKQWVCYCASSEYYSDYTDYDDYCEDWEERE